MTSQTVYQVNEDSQLKAQLAEILGVSDSNSWNVSDFVENLYHVHYNDKSAGYIPADVTSLRGVTVDLDSGIVVNRSYGYIPSLGSDTFLPLPNGTVTLNGDTQQYVVKPESSRIYRGINGTLLTVFLNGGKVYHATHRKLDSAKSKWGSVKQTFLQMYEELGGPKNEELFDLTKTHSPYVHMFSIVHPSVAVGTKYPIGNGFILYLGAAKVWDDSVNGPYKETLDNSDPRPYATIDHDLRTPNTFMDSVLYDELPVPGQLYRSTELTFPEAHEFLQYGWYPTASDDIKAIGNKEPRLGLGEFILVEMLDDNGNIKEVVKVESSGYTWRSTVRNNSDNLKFRYFDYMTSAYQRQDETGSVFYANMNPVLNVNRITREYVKLLVEDGNLFTLPLGDRTDIDTVDKRLLNSNYLFVLATPPHQQLEVLSYYDDFLLARKQVSKFLKDVYSGNNTGETGNEMYDVEYIMKAIARLINVVHTRVNAAVSNAYARGYRMSGKDKSKTIKEQCDAAADREYGASLYRLRKHALHVEDALVEQSRGMLPNGREYRPYSTVKLGK